jgi:cytochrome c-type biogenesis protein CcmH/NrfG
MRWAPWSSDPWRLLGDAEYARGDFAAARASYRKAIAKDPGDSSLWFDLGFAAEGRAAAEAFARAARLDPLSPDVARAQAEFRDPAPGRAHTGRASHASTNPQTGVGDGSPRGDGSRHPG